MLKLISIIAAMLIPLLTFASSSVALHTLDIPGNTWAIIALVIFIIAYALVVTEDFTHLNKSKPVVLAAGIIMVIVAILGNSMGMSDIVSQSFEHIIIEYGELLLFLMVAMAYINLMEDRFVFEKLKSILIKSGFGYLAIFWLTGIISFFLSAVADNLTTALVMSAVVLAIGKDNKKFVTMACVNVVVAANAGGAFSPFGDITTLMVWQSGVVTFNQFFSLFIPSAVNAFIPAIIMSFFLPKMPAQTVTQEIIKFKKGAISSIILFILTIMTAVFFEHALHLPPALGMMTGLGYVMFYNYFYSIITKTKNVDIETFEKAHGFNIFDKIKDAEWDTLLFFYGILVAVQGLSTLGYLALASQYIYTDMNSIMPSLFDAHTQANTILGLVSAVIDNITVMFAVLTMHPTLEHSQWLLVTLTAGTGGSLLAVGSAAGVAVMGKAKGKYTFMGHLKWTWVIAIGYFASIATHMLLS